jgi:DNA repair protein RadD
MAYDPLALSWTVPNKELATTTAAASFTLRYYQRNAVDDLHRYWLAEGGNALLVLPTGSGKSLVIAAICKEFLHDYPTLRIAIITHVRELIMQDYNELLALWPEAPAGIYSAGIGRRDAEAQIVFGGVMSMWNRVDELGAFDLILVDEAHLISHNKSTTYRLLFDALLKKRPDMRIAGLTATGFRLDTGRLDSGPDKIFDKIVYEANVIDLIVNGYLCKMVTKKTLVELNVDGVRKQAGEYITKELEIAVDRDWITRGACKEMIEYANHEKHGKRKAWLVFCVSVKHAEHVLEILREMGVTANCVFGHTPKDLRDETIQAFRKGEFTALVSVMVLGVGFNVPHVDMICLLRPTASAGLYIQQVGRGLRNAEGKDNCLVLDFAGNMKRHGPIDKISGKIKNRDKKEEDGTEQLRPEQDPAALLKICPNCHSYVPFDAKECPDCGIALAFEESKVNVAESPIKPTADAIHDIISDREPKWANVSSVRYSKHYKSGDPDAPPTMKVDYRCGLANYPEWVCFSHEGYAYEKACRWWYQRTKTLPVPGSVDEALERKHELAVPLRIQVRLEGKFFRILNAELQSNFKFDQSSPPPKQTVQIASPLPWKDD